MASPRLLQNIISFALLMLVASEHCEAFLYKTRVNITNELGSSKLNLTLHCRSKDDDLGEHVLPLGGTYQFSFRPNLFGTTLFFCRFQWAPDFWKIHWFDIFRGHDDYTSFCDECVWFIKPDGPCGLIEDVYRCFPWNKD